MTSSTHSYTARFLIGVLSDNTTDISSPLPVYTWWMSIQDAKHSDKSQERKINLQHKAFKKHNFRKLFWSEIIVLTCIFQNSKRPPTTLKPNM